MASTSSTAPFVAPVITEALLSEIKKEFKCVDNVPDCIALKSYFMERVRNGGYQKATFTPKDYSEISAMFPLLETVDENVYPLFDYYIEYYPAYSTLTDRLQIYTGIDDESMQQVFNHWYKEFYCYLRVKIKSIPMMIKMTSMENASTMTVSGKNVSSNIRINISGPSVNNLSFNRKGDDIIVKYKELENLPPVDAYPDFYMHLPHMKVDFDIPNIISISRSLALKYDRYLALRSTPQILKEPNEVKSSKKINPSKDITSYTYSFIEAFLKRLTNLLDASKTISPLRQHELLLVANEFLADVREINFYSSSFSKFVFGSNLQVTYLIGGKMYDRPHRHNGVNLKLLESLSPLVTISLNDFQPNHKHGPDGTTFQTLEMLAENAEEFDKLEIHNVLKYTCLKCSVFETEYVRILEHYKKEHPLDLPVVCSRCKNEVPISLLASKRWKHGC